jgi:hypothetical protein
MYSYDRRRFLQSGAAITAGLSVPTISGIAGARAARFPRSRHDRELAQKNVEVVGYTEVGRRPPFKLAIQEVGGRWLMYMGHLWDRGWSIVDVTHPEKPELLNFISGPRNTWTIQMEVADDKMITALEQIAPGWGGDPDGPFDEGVIIWDLMDPIQPQRLGQFHTGGTGTHRNFYDGGRYVHLAAGMPGFSGDIYVIIDIIEPSNPVEVGRWWVFGQKEGETDEPPAGVSQHGPPYVVGNLAYLAYGAAGLVILDISDVTNPVLVGQLDFTPPFLSSIGMHSVLPLPERNIAIANSEAIAEGCNEPLNHASVVDISDPSNPVLLSIFPVPEPPPGSPYANFCEKGGRFGPHNVNQHFHSPFVEQRDDLVYLTYFNAGLRIYDTSDPRLPREVGYFIPPEPRMRFGPKPEDSLTLQTEDVLVDARGFIYITQKNQGIWILRFTGEEKRDRHADDKGRKRMEASR